jgi:hypothetical protein
LPFSYLRNRVIAAEITENAARVHRGDRLKSSNFNITQSNQAKKRSVEIFEKKFPFDLKNIEKYLT